jgi:hypothetical protein
MEARASNLNHLICCLVVLLIVIVSVLEDRVATPAVTVRETYWRSMPSCVTICGGLPGYGSLFSIKFCKGR